MQVRLFQRVPVADGVHLATDVYMPDGPGPFPVLLARTPYHRAHFALAAGGYCDLGYAYVVQDTRGKYDSEGVFHPLVYEAPDGHDTLNWIANQNWCNGCIGMVGRSYLGIVQVPAASGGHEALRCILPSVAPASFFRDWVRYDGCFALANAVRWTITHATCPTQPALTHVDWDDLYRSSTLEEVFVKAGLESPALRAWVEHDQYDPYWEAVDQHRMYAHVKVPGLNSGGWFDHLTRGQFDAYRGLRDRGATGAARSGQRLLVGPWAHNTLAAQGEANWRYGDWEFGAEAGLAVREHEQRFIDHWMRDADNGLADEPPVKVFLMGENRWIKLEDWPPPESETARWYLNAAGKLTRESPGDVPPERYVYDPHDPVRTLGGPVYWGLAPGYSLGPVDQRPILVREDVLLFQSDPLGQPVAVAGDLTAKLWVISSAPDTDFVAKLCVSQPDGAVVCIAAGSVRCRYRNSWSDPQPMEPDTPTELRIHLGHTAYVFPTGSRIALTVTSSCFPRILPHPNTMAPIWDGSPPRVARQEILRDATHPSHLELPVMPV